jgi:hypothetical protein
VQSAIINQIVNRQSAIGNAQSAIDNLQSALLRVIHDTIPPSFERVPIVFVTGIMRCVDVHGDGQQTVGVVRGTAFPPPVLLPSSSRQHSPAARTTCGPPTGGAAPDREERTAGL